MTPPLLSSGANAIVGLAVILFAIGCYFIPTMIANSRHNPNTSGVFVVNLLVGWTFIGWIVALVMACSGSSGSPTPTKFRCNTCRAIVDADATICPSCGVEFTDVKERKCPYCAEMIKAEASVCRFCHSSVEPLNAG